MSSQKINEVIKQVSIKLDADSKKVIAKKFNCTTQTVRDSLKYILDSPKAKKIRQEAKSILLKQANKI